MRCAAILTKKRGLLRSNLLLVERLPLRVRPVFDGVVLDEVGLFHRRLPRYQEAVGILRHRQVPRRSWFWSCAEEQHPGSDHLAGNSDSLTLKIRSNVAVSRTCLSSLVNLLAEGEGHKE